MKKIIKNSSFLLAFFFLLSYYCNIHNINLITTEVLAMDKTTFETKIGITIDQGFKDSKIHFKQDFETDSGIRAMFTMLIKKFNKYNYNQSVLNVLCTKAKFYEVEKNRIQFLINHAKEKYGLASDEVEIMTNSNSSQKTK